MSLNPNSLFYRERQLVGRRGVPAKGDKDPRPPESGLLPISSATLWRKVKAGTFPRPVKLADKVTAWRADEVQAWMAGVNGTAS